MLTWFSSLKPSDENKRSLLDHVVLDQNSFIVCQQLEHRYFTMFNTYIDFGKYMYKKVSESHRCFYEVIMGESIQKPYFDLDVKIGPFSTDKMLTVNDSDQLVSQLIQSILTQVPMITIDDIINCSSHSSQKRSHHIIVNNWCVLNHKENRAFCDKVIEKIDPRLSIFIDSAVYKSVQQLRILGCHKFGSDRVKVLVTKSVTPMVDLASTIITNTSCCKILKYSFR